MATSPSKCLLCIRVEAMGGGFQGKGLRKKMSSSLEEFPKLTSGYLDGRTIRGLLQIAEL